MYSWEIIYAPWGRIKEALGEDIVLVKRGQRRRQPSPDGRSRHPDPGRSRRQPGRNGSSGHPRPDRTRGHPGPDWSRGYPRPHGSSGHPRPGGGRRYPDPGRIRRHPSPGRVLRKASPPSCSINLDDSDLDSESYSRARRGQVNGFGQISSGGGHGNSVLHQVTEIVTYREMGVQTEEDGEEYSDVTEEFFAINQGILTTTPRDIQMEDQKTLAEVTKPEGYISRSAGHLGRRNSASQTCSTSPGHPDIMPLIKTVRESIRTKPTKNPVPNIKLNNWYPDKVHHDNEQRDTEWLIHDPVPSDEDPIDWMEAATDKKLKKEKCPANVNMYCNKFVSTLMPLFIMMKWGGRFLWTSEVKDTVILFKIDRKSPVYISFLVTSFIVFFCTLFTVYNVIDVTNDTTETDNVYIQVERLEFDKNYQFVFWNFLICFFLNCWNIAVLMDNGVFITNWMNRWNAAVKFLRYDIHQHIQARIWIWMGGFVIYAGTLIALFCTALVPPVYDSSGLIGIMVWRNFIPKLRFKKYFILVRIFGLMFHLYVVFATKITLLFLISYCKLLENAGRVWNLRFSYKFKLLGHPRPLRSRRGVIYYTMVPLYKLLEEHRLITTFARQNTENLKMLLNIYVFGKGMEMILTIHRVLAYHLIPDIKFPDEFVKGALGETGEKLRYRDTIAVKQLSSIALCIYVCLGWFITCLNIADCGKAIHDGFTFVFHQGLTLCENARERDFINSLHFQLSPVTDYYIKSGFDFTRKFIHKMFLWIFIFTLGILSFHPFLLQKTPITICRDIAGEVSCFTIRSSRSQYSANMPLPIGQLESGTVLPPTLRRDLCETSWTFPNGSKIQTSILNNVFCSKIDNTPIPPFTPHYVATCFNDYETYFGSRPVKPYFQPYVNYNNPLVNCVTKEDIDLNERDDCGNVAIGIFQKVAIELELVQLGPSKVYACCYNYTGVDGNDASLKFCHMQSSVQAQGACAFSTTRAMAEAKCNTILTTTTPTTTPTTTTPTTTPTTTTPTTTMTTTRPAGPLHDEVEDCEDPYFSGTCTPNLGAEWSPPLQVGVLLACVSDPTRPPYNLRERHDVHLSGLTPCLCFNLGGFGQPYGSVGVGETLVDCQDGTQLDLSRRGRDSCGNLAFRHAIQVKVVLLINTQTGPEVWYLCCYNYRGVSFNSRTLPYCHTHSMSHAIRACQGDANKLRPGRTCP